MQLSSETPADWWEVEALFDLCFAPGREALSSYRLRDGVAPVAELCLLLRDDKRRRGRDPLLAGAGRRGARLLLGPIAVHPTHQSEGLGGWLIREAIARARAAWLGAGAAGGGCALLRALRV